jgi:hypothetical protein
MTQPPYGRSAFIEYFRGASRLQFGVAGSTPVASVCRLSRRDRRLWLLREMRLEGAHAAAVNQKRSLGHMSCSGIDFRMSAE